MSTKSPQKSLSYQWNLLLPQHAYEILLKKTKVPLLIGLVVLSLVGSVFHSMQFIRLTHTLLPQAKAFILSSLEEIYPTNLVVTVTNGILTTNSQVPVVIPYPRKVETWRKKESSSTQLPPNFITIDPKAHIEQFDEYETLILFTSNSVAYHKNLESRQTEFHTFEPNLNVKIDKAVLLNNVKAGLEQIPLNKITKLLTFGLPVIISIAGIWVEVLVTLFIMISIWVMMKSSSLHYTFWPVFLYTFAVSFLIRLVMQLLKFGPVDSWIPAVEATGKFLIVSLGYAGLMQAKRKNKAGEVNTLLLQSVLHPWYAGKDLLDSKRDGFKKICLAVVLFFFVMLPWIRFVFLTFKVATGSFT